MTILTATALAASTGPLQNENVKTADRARESSSAASPADNVARLDRALARRQGDQAREVVAELLQASSLSLDTLLEAGVKLAHNDLYAEASTVFSRCVKDYPDLFEGYYNLALADLALGRNSQALTILEKAPRSTHEQKVSALYLRGKTEAAMGLDNQAERDLREAFAAAPQEENYALDLGLLYMQRRDYVKAITVFEEGSRSPRGFPFVWFGLSLAQLLGGQPTKSVGTCREILQRDATFSPAGALLTFVLYMNGRYQEAEEEARKELQLREPYPYLFYLHSVAQLKLQSKDYSGMLQDLSLAAKGIPACSLCYLAESKVHQSMQAIDEATADLGEAVRIDPDLAEAWYRMASLYEKAGRNEDALKARAQFQRLKEENADRETEMIQNAFLSAIGGVVTPKRQ